MTMLEVVVYTSLGITVAMMIYNLGYNVGKAETLRDWLREKQHDFAVRKREEKEAEEDA